MDAEILNLSLEFAMEFGEHWLQPTQKRLSAVHPELSRESLDEYDSIARQTMKRGHRLVPECFRDVSGVEKAAQARFQTHLLQEYAWVSEKNLGHLFSQGCYYAWKDGDLL